MAERGFMIGALITIPQIEITRRVHEQLRARGFSDVQPAHRIVMQILNPEGDRVTELARQAGMTKQSMGYLVRQLETAGYLKRAPDPTDGRASLVSRTERGWEYNRAASDAVAQVDEDWTGLLGAAEMGRLKASLLELVTALGHAYEGSVAHHSLRVRGHPTSRLRPRGPGPLK